MNTARLIVAIFGFAIALSFSGFAHACRIGWDQHLFDVAPPQNALPGADIFHVRIANPDVGHIADLAVNKRTGSLPYSLIGVGTLVGTKVGIKRPFPVYALVTSCSALKGGKAWGILSRRQIPLTRRT